MRDLGVDMIKIGSAEVTRLDLLEEVASYGLPTFLEHGHEHAGRDRPGGGNPAARRTSRSCTPPRPILAPLEDLHLHVIRTLAERYRLPVGFPVITAGVGGIDFGRDRAGGGVAWSGTSPSTAP